jgi:hypothetical protein
MTTVLTHRLRYQVCFSFSRFFTILKMVIRYLKAEVIQLDFLALHGFGWTFFLLFNLSLQSDSRYSLLTKLLKVARSFKSIFILCKFPGFRTNLFHLFNFYFPENIPYFPIYRYFLIITFFYTFLSL